jgi:hypothetical protein
MKLNTLSEKEKAQMMVCVAHRNIRCAQRNKYNNQLDTMKNGECRWTVDYGQNKSIKKKPEEDSFDFFNKIGISIEANVIWFKFNDVVHKKIICFYSVHTTHTAQTSIDLFDRVLDYPEFKFIDTIYLWSDGGGHFKNNDFIMHIRDKSLELEKEIQYNQFCEYEGKDACDQFFGWLSNGLERHSRQKAVLDINDLYQFSKEYSLQYPANEYVWEIYHPIQCIRHEDRRAIQNLDDFLSFNVTNGAMTVAVTADQAHTPMILKMKPKLKGPLVYPAKALAIEEETTRDRQKRKKRENFYRPDVIGSGLHSQYTRRMRLCPTLKENSSQSRIGYLMKG